MGFLDSSAGRFIKTFFIVSTFGIAIAAPYVYNEFFAPKKKKPKPPKQYGEGGFADNSLEPYEQLSTVLGVRRIPAPYLAPPWLEYEGDSVFGRAIIGLAGRHEFTDPFSKGAPIEVIEDNYLSGDSSDALPSIYTETVWQGPGLDFARHALKTDTSTDERLVLAHSDDGSSATALYDLPKWQWYRLGRIAYPDEVHFHLLFDQGIRTQAGNKAGTAFQLALKLPDGSRIYLPALFWVMNTESPVRGKIIIKFGEDNVVGTPAGSSYAWIAAFESAGFQTNTNREADDYYSYSPSPGAPNANHAEIIDDTTIRIWVDPNQMATTLGMSIGIRQGAGFFNARFDDSDGSYEFGGGGVHQDHDYFGQLSSSGDWVCLEDQSKVVSHCILEHVTRFFDAVPIEPNGAACYEFRTQDRDIDQLTILAHRYVDRIWDRTTQAWVTAPHISSNPAALALHIMTTQNPAEMSRPLSDAQINLAEFGAWWEFCDDNGYECNAYIEPGGSWTDALELCFEAGFGKKKFVQQYGVYLETDRSGDDAVLVLSPRNADNFEDRVSFTQKPHAYRITFDDEEDDYQTSPELIVYAPGYSEDGADGTTIATLFEGRHYRSITKRWHAEKRGQVDINIVWMRGGGYSIDTDIRHLVGVQGKVVAVSHFVLNEHHGWAAIVRVIRNTVSSVEKIVGLELDGKVQLQSSTTGIRISKLDGETVTAQTSMTGYGNFVKFDTPLDDDTAIAAGATIVVGAVGEESIRCIVEGAQPNANLGATLFLVDEAPEIFA